MALMEIDEIAVDAALWRKAQNGDDDAKLALTERLEGEELYCHAMPVTEAETVVTLRALEEAGIVRKVRLCARL